MQVKDEFVVGESHKMRVRLRDSGEVITLTNFSRYDRIAARLLIRAFPNSYIHADGRERIRCGDIDYASIAELNGE